MQLQINVQDFCQVCFFFLSFRSTAHFSLNIFIYFEILDRRINILYQFKYSYIEMVVI